MASSAPPERKVVAQTGTGVSVAAVVYALLNFVPLFSNHLTSDEKQYIASWAPLVLGALAGYFAKHTPRLDDLLAAAKQFATPYIEHNAELNVELARLQAENSQLKSMLPGGGSASSPGTPGTVTVVSTPNVLQGGGVGTPTGGRGGFSSAG